MELKRTHELVPEVMWRDESPSTNAELREIVQDRASAGAPVPHGALLLTANQTAGRGRLDRGWVTPPNTALAISMLVRGFGVGSGSTAGSRSGSNVLASWGGLGPGWLPLIAGSAVQGALQPFFTADNPDNNFGEPDGAFDAPGEALRVGVKWPNDVHVRDEDDALAGSPGKKLCGILCELLPDGSAIVGMGINLLIPEWELPTDRATSLLAAGGAIGRVESLSGSLGEDLADSVVSALAGELLQLTALAATNPRAVRTRVLSNSLTLGTEVRVHLPGGEVVDGRARTLAADGSLVVDLPTGGQLTVSAGDVQHLR